MFRITPEIAHKLKCSQCHGFLSSKPINATPNGSPICALCYEVLSDEDKENYIPQTFLEKTVAPLFIFPCRYKDNGCRFEREFNQNVEHEKGCHYKFDKTPTNKPTIGRRLGVYGKGNYFCENGKTSSVCIGSEGIKLEVSFRTQDNYYDGIGTHHLNYSFRLQGNDNHELYVKNRENCEEVNFESIIGEGVLVIEAPTSILNSLTQVESKSNVLRKSCNNCQKFMGEEGTHHCLFGHETCTNCKGQTCPLCQTLIISKESISSCRNGHKGCTYQTSTEILWKHEIDCEFNNFRCPFPRCVFLNSLSDLKRHFLVSHKNNIIQNNRFSETLNGKKDKKWYIYYCENLFVCTYFYYVDFVEFLVQYVGAQDKSKLFQFEVELRPQKAGNFKRRAVCAGWNDINLCKGIRYEFDDLVEDGETKLQFLVNFKITQTAFVT